MSRIASVVAGPNYPVKLPIVETFSFLPLQFRTLYFKKIKALIWDSNGFIIAVLLFY